MSSDQENVPFIRSRRQWHQRSANKGADEHSLVSTPPDYQSESLLLYLISQWWNSPSLFPPWIEPGMLKLQVYLACCFTGTLGNFVLLNYSIFSSPSHCLTTEKHERDLFHYLHFLPWCIFSSGNKNSEWCWVATFHRCCVLECISLPFHLYPNCTALCSAIPSLPSLYSCLLLCQSFLCICSCLLIILTENFLFIYFVQVFFVDFQESVKQSAKDFVFPFFCLCSITLFTVKFLLNVAVKCWNMKYLCSSVCWKCVCVCVCVRVNGGHCTDRQCDSGTAVLTEGDYTSACTSRCPNTYRAASLDTLSVCLIRATCLMYVSAM